MPSLLNPEARARPRDPVRGLCRRADPRRAHLALPVHRVGRRPNPAAAADASSTTPTPTRTSSTTSPTTRPTCGVVLELGQELDDLIDCAGADCRGAPIGRAQLHQRRGRQEWLHAARRWPPGSPVPSEDEIVGVSFRAGEVPVGDDTDAAVRGRDSRLGAPRRAAAGRRRCTAKALFDDGRRLGQSANVRACSSEAPLAFAVAVAAARRWRGRRLRWRRRVPSRRPTRVFGSQPNFVFILTDDQNLQQFNRRYMRRTRKLIADPGTEFTQLLRRDAALLSVARGDAHRPVRPQQRSALERARLRPAARARQHPPGLAADRRLPDGRRSASG